MATARSKEKILQCAREMFYHIGYQTTSVDDIIQRCAVAKSNFYYHFKTKEQLAFAVLEMQIQEYETWIRQSLYNQSLTPRQRVACFFDQLCLTQQDMQKMAGCPFGNFAATLPTEPADKDLAEDDERRKERYEQSERFRQHISRLFRDIEAAMYECLAEGAACGEFRDDIAPAELAAFLLATIEGLLILTKTHQDIGPMIGGLAVAQRLICVR